jgi:chloramphenicol 3-O phosphotransferase
MAVEVIVLNGGSSSGKSTIARSLPSILAEPWLALGVDMLIEAMPASMQAGGSGIGFRSDGQVSVGPAFRALEIAWMGGVAAMAGAGAKVIMDDVFLAGAGSQRRWRDALAGLGVLWAGCTATPGP